MQAYVAIFASPAGPDVEFVEEREFLVLAASKEEAEAGFREYGLRHMRTWSIKLTDIRPSTDYLGSLKPEPGVVTAYHD
jgi:hypothetical protein